MVSTLEKLDKLYLTFATSSTTAGSSTIPVGKVGWINACFWKTPSVSAAGISGTLFTYNKDGDSIQITTTNSMKAASTSAFTGMKTPVEGGDILELRLNAIPGSASGLSAAPLTAEITLYLAP
jgi:hypothetical protein